MAANRNGEVAMNGNGMAAPVKYGLRKITTSDKHDGICHDMAAPSVKAQTIDELHSLQKKKSTPTTPIKGIQGTFAALSEEERQKQQLQSIRYILYLRNTLYYYYNNNKLLITGKLEREWKSRVQEVTHW